MDADGVSPAPAQLQVIVGIPRRIRIALHRYEIALHRTGVGSQLIKLLLIFHGKIGAIELEKHGRLAADLVVIQVGDDTAKLGDLLIVFLSLIIGLFGAGLSLTGASIRSGSLFIGCADGLSVLGDISLGL